MPPQIWDMMDFLGPLFALISVGTMVLIGMKMRLNSKIASRADVEPGALDRLTDVVENLHEDVRLLRDEVADLQDRVDFTERMLSSGSPGDREATPV
jgi:hypothetical protein